MTGPAVGEPDPDRAAPSRTGLRDAAGGLILVLVLGLAFRLIIAYLLPGSGFGVDVAAFRYWAENLASQGLGGFYDRPFFHDYTPGYLYVLWLVGKVGQLVGGPVGDLIKVPPILADAALAWVVWSMARELGASSRAALVGAFIVIVNPVTWFDSALWGQVDSVGTVVMLLALRELWRDRPERSAILAMLAALIKPQLGILIPIVAVVVIRRALRPDGAYGEDEPPPPASGIAWERTSRGPIRILTTAAAGLATAIVLALPFGLSLPGLIQQIFKTAAGYPYLSVNAYNPWALVTRAGAGVAANHVWICDSTVQPSGPVDIRIGDFALWSSPGSTLSCPDGYMIGALPAVLVGAALFVAALAIVMVLVARRPDRRTMLVGLAVLTLAFFVLPTRVHERYLYPLFGLAAILAAVSFRWRVAYVLSAAATFANMYAVLTTLYRDNPGIRDWLGIGPLLVSFEGVATAALIQVVVFAWVFGQLRDDRLDGLGEEIASSSGPEAWPSALASATGPVGAGASAMRAGASPGGAWALAAPTKVGGGHRYAPDAGRTVHDPGGGMARPGGAPAPTTLPTDPSLVFVPAWDDQTDASALGPIEWVRARLRDRPLRADRSHELDREPGGRVDRLDLWVLAVLMVGLLTVRIWRLSEPYSMHFDEVYHARTATEFLQDWRYGISHDIYEWTHPHLAKYAMAAGIVAVGGDRTDATSDLGVPIASAAIEPRWDSGNDPYHRNGDRLWVATGDEVRAYDLATRELVAKIALPGATAVAVDRPGHRIFVGLSSGELRFIDPLPLDAARNTGGVASLDARVFTRLNGPIASLFMPTDASTIAAVLPATGDRESVVLVNPDAATALPATILPRITQLADGGQGEIAVADADGVAFLDEATGEVATVVQLAGPAGGVAATTDLDKGPLYASYQTSAGPRVAVVSPGGGSATPSATTNFQLPGATAGHVFFDQAPRMVHVLGSVPGQPDQPTVYVIQPQGNSNAVYADAQLPFTPAAIVLDDNQAYPTTDRQQLLAFASGGGVASVAIGQHAWAWRLPGVLAGVAMGALLYLLARLLFRRRSVALMVGFLTLVDGMFFAQSRIGMNDTYVGLGIVAAYTLFAALWLRPGDSRRHWIAFAVGMPILGVVLGLALASKWVALYAIAGIGILILARSALGRLLMIGGLLVGTTVLGNIAIAVPPGESGGNYLFLAIMVALTLVAVVANVLHPVAWTWEERRIAIGAPIAVGAVILVAGLTTGRIDERFVLGSIGVSPLDLGFAGLLLGAVLYSGFFFAGRLGFGPQAMPPGPEDPTRFAEPPAPAPRGWLNLGSGFGLPAVWLVVSLLVIPLGVYIASYIPWAMVEGHQIVPGWPPGHTGQTLIDLTAEMYRYHNTLTAAHPASSPWWAWPFDFKPVWFYEQGFAGGTSASIYDAGNLAAWWLGIPALAFVTWQAFKRRSTALALITIGFAWQWLAWSRIERAAFQYHYYTALPFLLLALAYFLAELWHGASHRTWLIARIAAAVAILAPFGLWVLHRPLCGIARVTEINPGSQACPTTIPDLSLSPRAVAIAIVVGIGLLLLLRVLLSFGDTEADEASSEAAMRDRIKAAAVIALGVSIAFVVASNAFTDAAVLDLRLVPVEPIALVVSIALLPVAAYVATARDARRFVAGALGAIGFWFVIWYPNISGLPLPSNIHNAYQGFLPTYVYPFQFFVNTANRAVSGPPLVSLFVGELLLALTVVAVAVGYSAWAWRIALAERGHEEASWVGESPELPTPARDLEPPDDPEPPRET